MTDTRQGPDDGKPGENRMTRVPGMEPDGEARCELDGAGLATESDDEGPTTEPDEVACMGPVRSTHRM